MAGIAPARATRRVMNWSAIDSSTNTLDAAEHFWPPNPNALRAVPSTARSRSADEATITGFFPPISQIAGFGCDTAKSWMIDIPTALEPVKVTPSTRL